MKLSKSPYGFSGAVMALFLVVVSAAGLVAFRTLSVRPKAVVTQAPVASQTKLLPVAPLQTKADLEAATKSLDDQKIDDDLDDSALDQDINDLR